MTVYVAGFDISLHLFVQHCIDVVHIPSKHLLGHSLINIFIDGKLVVTAEMKLPPLTEVSVVNVRCMCYYRKTKLKHFFL